MGAISFSTDFFNRDAVQHAPRNLNEDRMEKAIVACEQKDAAILRSAVLRAIAWLTKPADTAPDAMESAILACQRRDQAIIWKLLTGN
jgi:hypothetical protein